MRFRSTLVAVVSVVLLAPGFVGAGLDPAIKCQAIKLKLAGKYASCRLLADATAVKNGETADYSTCDAKIAAGWQKVEDTLGSECPTTNDLVDVQDSIVECLPTTQYLVHFHLTSDDSLGGLEVDVDYALASGGFAGAFNLVTCTHLIPDTLASYHDDESLETLSFGVIDIDGSELEGPREIGYCLFESSGIAAPVASDFAITIVDSTNTDGFFVPGTTVIATITPLP